MQSGIYIPTNHFFAEKSDNMRPFHSYSFDKASKGFILMPRVEADEFEDPDGAAKGIYLPVTTFLGVNLLYACM